MSKIKVNNFSIKKIIGIVFLIITLIVGVALTNNTVRKFLFNSSANGGRVRSGNCDDIGSPGERNRCRMRKDGDIKASGLQSETKRLKDCLANSECKNSQRGAIDQAGGETQWVNININGYRCSHNLPGCTR